MVDGGKERQRVEEEIGKGQENVKTSPKNSELGKEKEIPGGEQDTLSMEIQRGNTHTHTHTNILIIAELRQ